VPLRGDRYAVISELASGGIRTGLGSVAQMPDDINHLLNQATEHHRAGQLSQARQLYESVLALSPDLPLAQFRLGLLEMQEGRPELAVRLIERAAEIDPNEPKYQAGLSQALFALACEIHSSGDLHGAENAYRRALSINPDHAGAMSNLAAILQARGELEPSITLLKKAIALEPAVAAHAVNLGGALCALRRFGDAEKALRPVLAHEPGNADAMYNLANALQGQGRLGEAAAAYQSAIQHRANFAEAWNNLGSVYKAIRDYSAAERAYRSAIAARPGFVAAVNNLGCLMRTMGRLEEAEKIFSDGLAGDATSAALHENLGNVLKDTGRLEQAIACYRRAVQLDPNNAGTHSNLVYSLSFCETDPAEILEEARRWNARHARKPLDAGSEVIRRAGSTGETSGSSEYLRTGVWNSSQSLRLRIGYVSPDFRDHCKSLFTIPLLSNHDHNAFGIFCYSSVERPDAITARIAKSADTWREVQHLDDTALARQIREDRIDILVDLTMHMANGRPGVFALKPAPIQIAWLAYPGTTGMDAMHYRISDPRLDPPGFESHYAEKTIRLPDAFWCYDPLTSDLPVNELPALANGHITFGCLNNPCKLTDHTLRLWAEVMQAIPDARLMLLMSEGSHRRLLLDRLDRLGISAGRVELANYEPRGKYLRRYHQVDIGLDTFPYNGHTTSLDSFWMGVPVVTRIGPTCVGRAGLCQLHQLALTELAAETDRAFVEVAVNLANDLPRLAGLRRVLRGRMESSALMDGLRFARNMEAVFRIVALR
jgi:predicted O-linked N-acetylglucosamine transferase (SPINDLY family)